VAIEVRFATLIAEGAVKSSLYPFVSLAAAFAAPAAAQAPTAAPAANAPTPVPRTEFIATMDGEFRQIDADKNGILTRREIEDFQRAEIARNVQLRLRALFQQLDSDKDGQLSPGEFASLKLPTQAVNAASLLAQVDGNKDGQVTLVEFRTGKLMNFDRMDADKDGVVSVAEMKAAGLIRQ
jgi:Ca2+-binding EF-hand superfamily protein